MDETLKQELRRQLANDVYMNHAVDKLSDRMADAFAREFPGDTVGTSADAGMALLYPQKSVIGRVSHDRAYYEKHREIILARKAAQRRAAGMAIQRPLTAQELVERAERERIRKRAWKKANREKINAAQRAKRAAMKRVK